MIGQVENTVDVIVPDVHEVYSIWERLLFDWGSLTWEKMGKFEWKVNGPEKRKKRQLFD